MESYELNTCAFVVKIWVEEIDDATAEVKWRGHITHVLDRKRRYFENLTGVVDFIDAYLKEMSVHIVRHAD